MIFLAPDLSVKFVKLCVLSSGPVLSNAHFYILRTGQPVLEVGIVFILIFVFGYEF